MPIHSKNTCLHTHIQCIYIYIYILDVKWLMLCSVFIGCMLIARHTHFFVSHSHCKAYSLPSIPNCKAVHSLICQTAINEQAPVLDPQQGSETKVPKWAASTRSSHIHRTISLLQNQLERLTPSPLSLQQPGTGTDYR